ncbi:MAG: polysaccharide deacetylase family protein [Oscillospiraceae bacterium]|nr:polysaccharide deacetylase family protein [Oscillospiraceae bacterium]
MDKYLIINADDLGSFLGANLATFDLLERGAITSSTVMTPCPWAKHAVRWAVAHPEYAIGVHLTTTSEWGAYRWGPVSPSGTDSLRDEEGYFWHESDQFEEHADMDEVEREVRAQLARAKLFGLNPSHWDNHMGSLYGIATGRLELLQQIFDLSADVGLPFRFPLAGLADQEGNQTLDIQLPKEVLESMFGQLQAYAKVKGVICPDYLIPHDYNGPQKESYDDFRDYMYTFMEEIPHGITETYLHPSLDTGEVTTASGVGIHRIWEYCLYADEKFQQHIKDCGIQKISYRDLAKMRG